MRHIFECSLFHPGRPNPPPHVSHVTPCAQNRELVTSPEPLLLLELTSATASPASHLGAQGDMVASRASCVTYVGACHKMSRNVTLFGDCDICREIARTEDRRMGHRRTSIRERYARRFCLLTTEFGLLPSGTPVDSKPRPAAGITVPHSAGWADRLLTRIPFG